MLGTSPPEREAPPAASGSGGSSKLTLALIAFGGISVGIGGGFFVASNASSDGADNAATYETNIRLRDQADTQRTISIVAGSAGLTLMGYGLYRALTSAEPNEGGGGGVSVVATPDLQGLSFSGNF